MAINAERLMMDIIANGVEEFGAPALATPFDMVVRNQGENSYMPVNLKRNGK